MAYKVLYSCKIREEIAEIGECRCIAMYKKLSWVRIKVVESRSLVQLSAALQPNVCVFLDISGSFASGVV